MIYPVIMISFDNDIFDNYLHIQLMIRTTTCLNALPTWDGFRVILIFHYLPWKCIESHWLHVNYVILVPVSRITVAWYLTCILISAFSLYLCWYGLRYQSYGPGCYQMTTGNTRLSLYLWSTTYSVIGNSIWYGFKNDMIAVFPFPCCFNYHLKLHTFSHEIKSNQNKLKIIGHHLSPSISTLILLNGL